MALFVGAALPTPSRNRLPRAAAGGERGKPRYALSGVRKERHFIAAPVASAAGPPRDGGGSSDDVSRLNALLNSSDALDGYSLRNVIRGKYGKCYDIQLRRVAALDDQIVLNIMWRYLEQVSFPLTELEYLENCEAIAQIINSWGLASFVQKEIQTTKKRPQVGKAVSIFLPVDKDNARRAAEWLA
eukprot:tig00000241_g20899.t1